MKYVIRNDKGEIFASFKHRADAFAFAGMGGTMNFKVDVVDGPGLWWTLVHVAAIVVAFIVIIDALFTLPS